MKCALIDAAVVVATFATFATPALSPVVKEDPDSCAQFCLNKKCQNLGPGDPYADGVYYHNDPAQTAEPDAYCNHGR